MARTTDEETFLPLTPQVFHILLALGEGRRHGYAIMREVAANSGGKVKLSTGTLYAAIRRLLEGGLINETDERPPAELDDQRRRYYELTRLGRKVAKAEAQRLADLYGLARQKKLT